MKKIIITAFAPFNGREENASFIGVNGASFDCKSVEAVKLLLPVEYNTCFDLLKSAIDSQKPDGVICFGEAPRKEITPEFFALNVMNATIGDNKGVIMSNMPINPNGESSYKTKLPADRIVAALIQSKLPAAPSFHAGTYVCNNLFYLLMQYVANEQLPCGFIHVPLLKDGKTGMKREKIIKSVQVCVTALADYLG
ncbi:MAG: pyroglutamyl-peptidase I [Clostridia bacterium]|nr:pyroglutamyl-peptidase I [Clostridia bacterium]